MTTEKTPLDFKVNQPNMEMDDCCSGTEHQLGPPLVYRAVCWLEHIFTGDRWESTKYSSIVNLANMAMVFCC